MLRHHAELHRQHARQVPPSASIHHCRTAARLDLQAAEQQLHLQHWLVAQAKAGSTLWEQHSQQLVQHQEEATFAQQQWDAMSAPQEAPSEDRNGVAQVSEHLSNYLFQFSTVVSHMQV